MTTSELNGDPQQGLFVIGMCKVCGHKYAKLDGAKARCPECLATKLEVARADLTKAEAAAAAEYQALERLCEGLQDAFLVKALEHDALKEKLQECESVLTAVANQRDEGYDRIKALKKENDQLRVQLAGCGVAALSSVTTPTPPLFDDVFHAGAAALDALESDDDPQTASPATNASVFVGLEKDERALLDKCLAPRAVVDRHDAIFVLKKLAESRRETDAAQADANALRQERCDWEDADRGLPLMGEPRSRVLTAIGATNVRDAICIVTALRARVAGLEKREAEAKTVQKIAEVLQTYPPRSTRRNGKGCIEQYLNQTLDVLESFSLQDLLNAARHTYRAAKEVARAYRPIAREQAQKAEAERNELLNRKFSARDYDE